MLEAIHRRLGSGARIALMLLAALLVPRGPVLAQEGAVKQKFGSWELRCATPPGASNEICLLVQDVTDAERPNVALNIVFLQAPENKGLLMRVVAPVGVLLPYGLRMAVDGKDFGKIPYLKCSVVGGRGCIAETLLQTEIVDKLKTGKEAWFTIFHTPELGIAIPVSLAGLGEGLAKVK
ncbi:MAG: invasion associated locus B family protein [Pseudomonadota bacterium]|nr:invasion associated locus B family protein [Pseudomonadota bacterium]